jgi:hypothetical protein
VLDSRYQWVYDGSRIKDEQEVMASWPLKSQSHKEWVAMKAMGSTEEEFSLVIEPFKDLNMEAKRLEQALLAEKGALVDATNVDNSDSDVKQCEELRPPALALWMCHALSAKRPALV